MPQPLSHSAREIVVSVIIRRQAISPMNHNRDYTDSEVSRVCVPWKWTSPTTHWFIMQPDTFSTTTLWFTTDTPSHQQHTDSPATHFLIIHTLGHQIHTSHQQHTIHQLHTFSSSTHWFTRYTASHQPRWFTMQLYTLSPTTHWFTRYTPSHQAHWPTTYRLTKHEFTNHNMHNSPTTRWPTNHKPTHQPCEFTNHNMHDSPKLHWLTNHTEGLKSSSSSAGFSSLTSTTPSFSKHTFSHHLGYVILTNHTFIHHLGYVIFTNHTFIQQTHLYSPSTVRITHQPHLHSANTPSFTI